MNSQQAQIQELIQSIDAALRKASPRLPWVMAGESEQQRQLLERTRQYLVSLQQSNLKPELPNSVITGIVPSDPALGPIASTPPGQSSGESAQQVLQAVLQEVTYLRTNIMQPMRGEVDDLRQQRDALVSEIRELEAQRQQYALPPQADTQQQQQALSEFLQSLMGRLQENLTVQVAEMLTTLESRTLPPARPPSLEVPPVHDSDSDAARFASYIPPLTPQERLDQLQRIQTQSDQLLLKLDTTLRVIFESLQRNMQTYEDSLSQGLDKMHTLGHQGEAIFTALVNRLAQQLGREASQYLQSSLEGTDWQALPGSTGRPLAGSSRADASPLDSLISELAESEATILQPPTGMGTGSRLTDLNREVEDMELVASSPNLDDLDPDEMTMFQVDESLMATRFQDDDMTIFQINEAAIAPLQEIPLDDAPLDNAIDDIDSALELLNQISTELETEDDDAADASQVTSPEGIYDELDALYQSLFGADVTPQEDGTEPPVDRHIADAEQAVNSDLEPANLAVDPQSDGIDDFEDDFESQFFGGLADLSAQPAEVVLEEPQLTEAEAVSQESGQTIEQLLFDEVPVADGGDQEDTQLLNAASIGSQQMPADVISSLEDLIALSDSASSLEALRSEGSFSDEDIYIPASPDEDLLVGEAVVEVPRVELQVDENVLQQLDAELSTLEGRTPDSDEELAFLSELETDESEDISTSLEDAFREIPYEESGSPEARLAEAEDNEAFLETLPTSSPEPLPIADEALVNDLLLDEIASDSIEEDSLELLDEPSDIASEPATQEAPFGEGANAELPSGPWSAYVVTDEELPGEPTPGEVPELDLLLTQESLTEDFTEGDDDQTAAFFPEIEAPGDLLESLMEDIPLTAFEEENLPSVDEALIDRLIEETPAESAESDTAMDLSSLLSGDSDIASDSSAPITNEAQNGLDLSTVEIDEQSDAPIDLSESVVAGSDEAEPESANDYRQSDALANLPDFAAEGSEEGWLDLSSAETDEQHDFMAELPASTSNEDEDWLNPSATDTDEPSDLLTELTEFTADEDNDLLTELTETTSDEDEDWLNLSTTDTDEQSDLLMELAEPTADEDADLLTELTEATSDEDEDWLNLSATDTDEQSDFLTELTESTADEDNDLLAELTEPTSREDEDWLNLSAIDTDEQRSTLDDLSDDPAESSDEAWLEVSGVDSNVSADALADLSESAAEELDEAWLDLSTSESIDQEEVLLQELPEAPTEVTGDEWIDLSSSAEEPEELPGDLLPPTDEVPDADADLMSQPIELSFEEALEAPEESLESAAASLSDDDLFGFGIDLPELTDSAPPPPPLFLEEEQPPAENVPGEAIALTPSEPLLPPDREDLTLEAFQDVMTTPPASIEELLAEWPDDPEVAEVSAASEAAPTETAPLPLISIDTPEPTPDITLALSADATEETLDSFADALNTASDTEDIVTPMELAAWFDGVEEIPPAIEVTPPGAQATSLDDTSLFLETLSVEAPPEPSLDDNAFTLEGLGDLFESVPDSVSAASAEPTEPAETQDTTPANALGTDFGQAGIDLYAEENLEPDSEESKKKDLGDRPPEDSVALTETASDAADVSLGADAPTLADPDLDYTSELILQAIGLQADEALEANAVPLPDEIEPDLALMDLTADLEDEEDEVDPELAALFQRLRRSPLDLPDSNDPLGDRLELLRDQEDDLDSLIFSVTDPLEEDPSLFAPPSLTATPKRVAPRSPWYLGIDLGTTGISAVLLHRPTATLHPMFWLEIKFPGPIHGSLPVPEKSYRLPMAVYVTPKAPEGAEVAIASLTITRQEFSHPTQQPLRDFKSALRAGIPYYTADTAHWEPVLQWSDQRTIPLSTLHQALRALLASLNYTNPEPPSGADTSVLSCGAMGLPDDTLQQALQDLAGVIVSYPAAWSDTYRFNVREAILAARLVDDPGQIYLVEESTATLLSALAPAQAVTLPSSLALNQDLFQAQWQGGTLVINGGASVTELALVNLPENLQRLSPTDIARRTLPYGGNALDQDIICQLIYPAWVRQAHRSGQSPAATLPENNSPFRAGEDLDWADPWAALGWEHLILPIVGDPDPINRQVLQQRLLGAGVGLGLMEAARYLKLTLQQQERGTLTLGDLSLTISRQDLGSRVLLPYVQRLNRELNNLLTQTGIPVLQVNQVLCTGGSASLAAIARWLRQKLPNATIVQDTYTQPEAPQHNHLSTCSRVAYGLAAVPLHPRMVDQGHHCYSDYFLLMELLRVFPEAPITLEGILRLLEQRGVDVQACQAAIVALLEGHLPAGFVPADGEAAMLTPASQHNPDYRALLAAPLFVREADQTYRPNPHQWQVFRRHLDIILATSYQKLAEPLDFMLDTAPRL